MDNMISYKSNVNVPNINTGDTVVLTIEDLYLVAPHTRELESVKFLDIADLLKRLIKSVERTGEWEFVQYVQIKPSSLFIIRKINKSIAEIPCMVQDNTPYTQSIKSMPNLDSTLGTTSVPEPSKVKIDKLPWE